MYDEGEVDRAAAPIGGIRRPEYPARERLLGRAGRVSLLVEVDAAGAVRDVRVARSAGEAFDASARRAVERTPFRPARLGDRAVASTVTVNVTFELD
ncbi:MAG TPA: energy transducer TonB [Myxococcota bacterium]